MIKIHFRKVLALLDAGSSNSGIFEVNDNFLLCTNIHGGKDGSLYIELDKGYQFKVKNVGYLKHLLVTMFDLRVDFQKVIILITPCHPGAVLERYGKVLETQGIRVYKEVYDKLSRVHRIGYDLYLTNGQRIYLNDTASKLDPQVKKVVTSPSDLVELEPIETLG